RNKYLFSVIQIRTMGLFSALIGNAGAVDQLDLQKDYGKLLIDGEEIELGFKLIRDVFIFTNKRLILIDKQGFTGSKIEYKSISYKSISRFSIETTGTFDLDAELKIWVSSELIPSIKKQFNKSVNVYDVHKVLATYVLK
ncbi:MAG: helicase, partial [Daejeonella sp.]|nr:helicase [Daejeonella sp.]